MAAGIKERRTWIISASILAALIVFAMTLTPVSGVSSRWNYKAKTTESEHPLRGDTIHVKGVTSQTELIEITTAAPLTDTIKASQRSYGFLASSQLTHDSDTSTTKISCGSLVGGCSTFVNLDVPERKKLSVTSPYLKLKGTFTEVSTDNTETLKLVDNPIAVTTLTAHNVSGSVDLTFENSPEHVTIKGDGARVMLWFNKPPQHVDISLASGDVTITVPDDSTEYNVTTNVKDASALSTITTFDSVPEAQRTINVHSSGNAFVIISRDPS